MNAGTAVGAGRPVEAAATAAEDMDDKISSLPRACQASYYLLPTEHQGSCEDQYALEVVATDVAIVPDP